ncbi:unnamed protein product [Meloidogyne enterolobii]|uniref:Uncharacterized protein n=1 Tax=Meloidogyne enterolobii TaxID=390850 RepID=A0ACB1AWN3_MELEN
MFPSTFTKFSLLPKCLFNRLTRVVYGSGLCSTGALAIEKLLTQQVPFKLGKIVGAEATGVSCIVCNSDGQVFTWGSHVLGFGPKIEKFTKPMQIDPPLFTSAMNEKNWVVKVFAGGSCMGALTEAGHLFTWSSNKHGVLALSHRNQQYFLSTFTFKRSFHSGNDKPKGIFQNFKDLFKRYWYIAFPVHLALSILWFSIFYSTLHLLLLLGYDVVSLLEFLRLPKNWIQKIRDLPKSAGTLTATLILFKVVY